MKRRNNKLLVLLTLGSLVAGGVGCGVMAFWQKDESGARQSAFVPDTKRFDVIAHRGGAGLWPENTMYAFERARKLGADVIETDVRSTSDGVLVLLHDATVERTTNGTGPVNKLTLAELKKLDAGFRWSPDGGRTFPLRGRGITVPTLEEAFTAWPEMRFNIEPKQETPAIIEPLCEVIQTHGMADKIIIGSFNHTLLEKFRGACPEIVTSASTAEVTRFLATLKDAPDASSQPRMGALQVPEYAGGFRVLTSGFVEAAHRRQLKVHAWTVNETKDMRRLLEMGVDGLMTDYPDRLLQLLGRPSPR